MQQIKLLVFKSLKNEKLGTIGQKYDGDDWSETM